MEEWKDSQMLSLKYLFRSQENKNADKNFQ